MTNWIYGLLWLLFDLQREKERTEQRGRQRAALMHNAQLDPQSRVSVFIPLPEKGKHGNH